MADVAARRSADGSVLGALLVVGGGGWLLREVGVDLSWTAIGSVVLVALGLGMVLTAHRRGTTWLVGLGAGLALALAASSSVSIDSGLVRGGFGEKVVAPRSIADLEPSYSVAAGRLVIDLSRMEELPSQRLVLRVGTGELSVIVPERATVTMALEAGAGDVRFLDREGVEGVGLDRRFRSEGPEGAPTLELDVSIGLGAVEVVRGPS